MKFEPIRLTGDRLIRHAVLVMLSGMLLIMASCNNTMEHKTVREPAVDTAISSLDRLNAGISTDSLNPQLYHQRAMYFMDQNDVNSALSDIGRAIELNDRNPDYFVTLADLYLMSGRMPNCLESLQRAEELDPNHNSALLRLAEAYLILKDYQNTFAYSKRALDLDRINPVAHFIRGYAYMELGDTSLAIKNFQAAADQDQQYYNAFVELGVLYTALRSPLSTGYLQTAINIEPGRPEAYYLLGMAYQEMENIPKALETYDRLLAIDPEYKEAYYNSGYLNLVYLNDFETAIRLFTRAIELDPSYTDAYFNRGYSFELSGDFDNARKDYLKAMEITPNYERSITGLNRLDGRID